MRINDFIIRDTPQELTFCLLYEDMVRRWSSSSQVESHQQDMDISDPWILDMSAFKAMLKKSGTGEKAQG